jgi:hypothetical protein
MKPKVVPAVVNSAQTSERREIKKVAAFKRFRMPPICALRGRRENMTNITKDKLKGTFPEVRGTKP